MRSLDQKRHTNFCARARTKYLAAFFSRHFALCSLVASQIQDVNDIEFIGECSSHAGGGVALDPSAICNKRDDAAVCIVDSIGRPAKCAYIRIIHGILIRHIRTGDIRLGDACVEIGVFQILVVVVGIPLANRIGWVSDDDLDGCMALAFDLFGIFFKEVVDRSLSAFVEFERIGEANIVEIDIFIGGVEAVKDGFDIDVGDVVGEQDDFVAVEFLEVFAFEVFVFDDAGL